jgi:hypothetical protein
MNTEQQIRLAVALGMIIALQIIAVCAWVR